MQLESGSKEWTVLCKLCKAFFTQNSDEFNSKIINWDKLLLLAANHQVTAIIFKGIISNSTIDNFPPTFINALKAKSFQNSIKSLQYFSELLSLIDKANQRNIDLIPLKGLLLSTKAFGEVGLREFCDIDFLFPFQQMDAFRNLLETDNYQISVELPAALIKNHEKYNCEYSFFKRKKNTYINVEPHWFIGNRRLQINLAYSDIQPLTKKEVINNVSINTLTPEGLLLTTCIHHSAKDQISSLKQVCDLAAIIFKFQNELDWDLIFSKSEDWKVLHLILFSLGGADAVFQLPLPSAIRQKLNNKTIQKRIKACLINLATPSNAKKEANDLWKEISFHLTLRKSWSTKLKICYYHLVQAVKPNIEDLKDMEATKSTFFWITLKKPFRLWHKYVYQSSK